MGTLFGNGLMKIKRFLNMVMLSELRIFLSSLLHSLMTDEKINVQQKLIFSAEQWNFLVHRVEQALLIQSIKLNR